MKILCVEDGSIDIELLEEEPLQDGKILVYRQGAKPPFLLELSDNKCNETKIRADERRKVCEEIREFAHSKNFLHGMEFISLLHELDKIEGGESK